MSNTTVKQAFKDMDQLIRRSGGLFQKTLLLVFIPVFIINCYNFYMAYGGVGLDYSALQSIDFNSALQGNTDAMNAFSEALINVFPQPDIKHTFGDYALELIDILLIVFLDAFIIILGTTLMQDKKLPASELFKQALKKVPSVLLLSIVSSWIIYEIESIIYSSIFVTFASFQMSNHVMIYTAVGMLIMFMASMILLSCWFLMYIHYMAIAIASGRCRFMFALGYAKAILKGNVWRQMLHISPFIILGFILPVSLQAIGIALSKDIYVLLVLVAISALLEIVVFAHMWMHTIPEFFALELQSGIQVKIREMINKAMNMHSQNNNQHETDNNNTENNTDDIEPKE